MEGIAAVHSEVEVWKLMCVRICSSYLIRDFWDKMCDFYHCQIIGPDVVFLHFILLFTRSPTCNRYCWFSRQLLEIYCVWVVVPFMQSLAVSCDVVQKHWVMSHCLWLEPAVKAVPGWAHSCSIPTHATFGPNLYSRVWMCVLMGWSHLCVCCIILYNATVGSTPLCLRTYHTRIDQELSGTPTTQVAGVKHPLTTPPQAHTANNNWNPLQHMRRLNSGLQHVSKYWDGNCQVGEHLHIDYHHKQICTALVPIFTACAESPHRACNKAQTHTRPAAAAAAAATVVCKCMFNFTFYSCGTLHCTSVATRQWRLSSSEAEKEGEWDEAHKHTWWVICGGSLAGGVSC